MTWSSSRVVRITAAMVGMIAITSCGSSAASVSSVTSSPTSAATQATPTLTPYDQELLRQLTRAGIQAYETPIQIGTYVFEGAGLNYDQDVLSLGYGGLVIDEWTAVNFDPSSGKCRVSAQYAWNCGFLARTPGGHDLYAGPSGGLPGYPADLGDVYVELGPTALHVQGATGQKPTLKGLVTVVDGMAPAAPAQVVALNQKARDFAQHLKETAASRIDFKTYLPQKGIQNFVMDKEWLLNPTDPLHPYVDLHFHRITNGNQAYEFEAFEFRDDIPLSSSHCGFLSPELNGAYDRCAFSFTTPKGISIYSTYGSMRFDLGSTRVTFMLDMKIDLLAQTDVTQFVDSFVEVPAKDIQGA